MEFADQFPSGHCALDPIDVNEDAGASRGVVIVAVHAGIGTLNTRPDRDELQPIGYRLHVEIGVQRDGEGRGDECAGNADAVANLKAMIGRVERNDEVMVNHWALRLLRNRGGSDGRTSSGQKENQHQSRKGGSHGATLDHERR